MAACPKCLRPAWKSHGGMGGGIMPDSETNCVRRDGRDCRTAAAGVAAERERCLAWASPIDDGVMPTGRTVDEAIAGIESGAPAPRE